MQMTIKSLHCSGFSRSNVYRCCYDYSLHEDSRRWYRFTIPISFLRDIFPWHLLYRDTHIHHDFISLEKEFNPGINTCAQEKAGLQAVYWT